MRVRFLRHFGAAWRFPESLQGMKPTCVNYSQAGVQFWTFLAAFTKALGGFWRVLRLVGQFRGAPQNCLTKPELNFGCVSGLHGLCQGAFEFALKRLRHFFGPIGLRLEGH